MTDRGAGPGQPGRPSVLLYTAQWCSVCAQVAPLVEQVAERYPDVSLRMIDVDNPGETPVPVKGVPTVTAVLGNGEVTGRKTGTLNESEIVQLFEAADSATRIRGSIDATTRLIRLGSGTALIALGLASAAPVLIVLGACAVGWGTYDLLSIGAT